jgi:hypothetical protein
MFFGTPEICSAAILEHNPHWIQLIKVPTKAPKLALYSL